MKKEVFRSLFYYGFAITTEFQPMMQGAGVKPLERGKNRAIQLLIGSELCPATLTNQSKVSSNATNEQRSDILQVRYGENSKAAMLMRESFPQSFTYLESQFQAGNTRNLRLPDNSKEYFVINATTQPDVFEVVAIQQQDLSQLQTAIQGLSEYDFENATDDSAGFRTSVAARKVRKLDRSIGDSLKRLYDYRCQITGEKIGEECGQPVIEAHHIDYFTHSLNNDASNIIIISPNFHRIIHQNNPEFNRLTMTFDFPNGYRQKVILDRHLHV